MTDSRKPFDTADIDACDDTDLIDWLKSQEDTRFGWLARDSTSGRGYRLHQTSDERAYDGAGKPVTIREAIREAMKAERRQQEYEAGGRAY